MFLQMVQAEVAFLREHIFSYYIFPSICLLHFLPFGLYSKSVYADQLYFS